MMGSLGGMLRRVSKKHPKMDAVLDQIELFIARFSTRGRTPYHNIISLDPRVIRKKKKPYFHYLKQEHAVVSGDWDLDLVPFADSITYRGLEQHFLQNQAWPDTEYFQYVLSEINTGNYLFDCQNKQELLDRCYRIDDLYNSIKTYGVVIPGPKKSLGMYDSITVNIGRDGEIIFNNGNHRLAIAQILGFSQIDVRVLVRHTDWLDALENNQVPKNHPDSNALIIS